MAFEESTRREDAMIPNSQIEEMFMRICSDSQMTKYIELVEKGHVSLATAYASQMVKKVFYKMLDVLEGSGISVDDIQVDNIKIRSIAYDHADELPNTKLKKHEK